MINFVGNSLVDKSFSRKYDLRRGFDSHKWTIIEKTSIQTRVGTDTLKK